MSCNILVFVSRLCHPFPRPRLLSITMAVTAVGLLLAGCGSGLETEVAKLVVLRGDEQTGAIGGECGKDIVVEVLGPQRRGILGGKGEAHPVPDVTVVFEAADTSGLTVIGEPESLTDAAGIARVKVRLGNRFGDQYLRVRLPDHPGLKATVRLIAGVKIDGGKQETAAGDELEKPITLTITDEAGAPVEGVPVYFRLVSQPGKKGKVKALQGATDASGVASAQVATDSKATGKYEILAEIADEERGIRCRALLINALALNRLGLLIGVFGGLGVFIFGMKLMSEGLQQIAGNRMKSILAILTRNRFTAVGAGAVITGLIQSSSACTVMVVGFANAGLLSLQQAIGVVYGANIGTTITGQMVSFKLNGLALPCVAIGVALLLVTKRGALNSFGQTILGFGLLFLGMTMMSHELKQIAGFPSFIAFFQKFDCTPGPSGVLPFGSVLGAILIGTAMTVIVQSSSATIGLTIALASSGLINFYTAVPLILGDNIGTTVTALLASIGTNRSARQTAVAHTLFNVLGASYMVILFYVRLDGVPVFMYLINQITSGNVFAETPENIGRHVASAHTTFNIFNVVVFLPLVGVVAKLCRKVVPEDEAGVVAVQQFEPHLLDTPAIAVRQSYTALAGMTATAWDLFADAFGMMTTYTEAAVPELREREDAVDRIQHDAIDYLVQLTQRRLDEGQSASIPLLMHCVNDAERIGDHAMNLIALAQELVGKNQTLSKAAAVEAEQLFGVIKREFELVRAAFGTDTEDNVARALTVHGEARRVLTEIHQSHERRLRKAKCSVDVGIIYVELLRELERTDGHLTNIAERLVELHRHADSE